MYQIKKFNGIEEANKWLSENTDIEAVDHSLTPSMMIVILYKIKQN